MTCPLKPTVRTARSRCGLHYTAALGRGPVKDPITPGLAPQEPEYAAHRTTPWIRAPERTRMALHIVGGVLGGTRCGGMNAGCPVFAESAST